MRFVRATLLSALAALLLAPAAAHAQAVTAISANAVDAGNGPVTGTLCFTAVNTYNNPISVTKTGGGLFIAGRPFCQTLTAGALVGSLTVPNPVTDSAPGHAYDITVYDNASGLKTDVGQGPVFGIGGVSWSLDTYVPPSTVPTAQAFTFTTGTGTAPSSCIAPALDVRVNSGVATESVCSAGVFLSIAGAGGGSVSVPASLPVLASDSFGHIISASSASIQGAIGSGVYNQYVYAGDCLGFFDFSDTTGPALPNLCGTGSGSVGSSAPTRTGTSYSFTGGQTATFPALSATPGTIFLAVGLPVYATGSPSAQMPLGNQLLLSGPFDWDAHTVIQGYGLYGVSSSTFGSGGAGNSGGPDQFTGTHVLAISCPTTGGPKFYIDGILTSYNSTVSNAVYGCNYASSNPFEIGASPRGGTLFSNGNYYFARFSAAVLTDAQVAQNTAIIQSIVQQRGVLFQGRPYVYPTAQYIAAGDSITCGYLAGGSPPCGVNQNSSYAYAYQISGLTNPYQVQVFGQSGALVQGQIANIPWLYGPQSKAASGASIVSLFEGTNNAFYGTNNAADTWQLNVAWNRIEKSYGPRTFVFTMLDDYAAQPGNIGFKHAFVAAAQAGWKTAGFDAIADVGSDPILGCDNCSANTTYFVDGLHPTQAGQEILAQAASCAINWIDGSSPSNMNPVPITAPTYTAGCGDGGLIIDATANNVTVDLNSARWQTGRVTRFCNNTTSGTNTVTLVAPSDYNFNKGTSSGVLIANNGCADLTAMWNGSTSSPGDYWRVDASPAVTLGSGPSSAATVTTQPTSQTIVAGATVSFTSAATGAPTPTIQWQTDGGTSGATWTNIAGATSGTYSFVTANSQNNYQYRAAFTNSAGTVNSNPATLTIAGYSNLVLYAPINEGSGTTFNDIVGGDNFSAGAGSWSGSNWVFIGGNNNAAYATTNPSAIASSVPWSIGGWFTPANLSATTYLWSNMAGASPGVSMALNTDGSLTFTAIGSGSGSVLSAHTAAGLVTAGARTQIYLSVDGSNSFAGLRCYVNGTAVSLTSTSNTLTTSIAPSSGFYFMIAGYSQGFAGGVGSGSDMPGVIDHFRIYNAAVSAGTVSSLYSAGQ